MKTGLLLLGAFLIGIFCATAFFKFAPISMLEHFHAITINAGNLAGDSQPNHEAMPLQGLTIESIVNRYNCFDHYYVDVYNNPDDSNLAWDSYQFCMAGGSQVPKVGE